MPKITDDDHGDDDDDQENAVSELPSQSTRSLSDARRLAQQVGPHPRISNAIVEEPAGTIAAAEARQDALENIRQQLARFRDCNGQRVAFDWDHPTPDFA